MYLIFHYILSINETVKITILFSPLPTSGGWRCEMAKTHLPTATLAIYSGKGYFNRSANIPQNKVKSSSVETVVSCWLRLGA